MIIKWPFISCLALCILAAQHCSSIPAKIGDERLVNLSERENNSLETLKTQVISAKHRKDLQKSKTTTEAAHLNQARITHTSMKEGVEKQGKEKEIDALASALKIEEKRAKISGLELGSAIAALERQKARIIAVRSRSEMNSDAYDIESENLEKSLADEKSELSQMEKRTQK